MLNRRCLKKDRLEEEQEGLTKRGGSGGGRGKREAIASSHPKQPDGTYINSDGTKPLLAEMWHKCLLLTARGTRFEKIPSPHPFPIFVRVGVAHFWPSRATQERSQTDPAERPLRSFEAHSR